MRMRSVQERLANSIWHSLSACAFLTVVSAAVGQDLPEPRNHVEDRANVLNTDVKQRLNRYLAELERKTGAQMIVLTIDTTGGMPIEQFSHELAERWKLGQLGKDNGLLVVVAVKDERGRIEVGYGLEPILPDGLVGTIGRRAIKPAFTDGDYSKHVYEGALLIANRIASSADVQISGMPAMSLPRRRGAIPCVGSLLPLIIIMIVISSTARRGRARRRWGGCGSSGWLTWMLLGSMLGGGRRHYGGGSSWGGGFGGGGFGGGGFGGGSFGGGGGGSFGGGGASF